MVELTVGLGALAYFNEQAMEYLVGQWKTQMGKFMVYLASAVGIAEAYVLNLNILPLMGLDDNAYLGYVVTGLAIGGLSNVLHKYVGKPSRNNGE